MHNVDSNLILKNYISKLTELLEDESVNDIMINGAHDIFIEREGTVKKYEDVDKVFTLQTLESVSKLMASESNPIGEHSPILSSELPGGERVEIITSPAVPEGSIVMSIRKHNSLDLSVNDFKDSGAFDNVRLSTEDNESETDIALRELYKQKDILNFLKVAVPAKKTFILAGATGSGKTTFANGILKLVPKHERVITIENIREAIVHNPNKVHLITPAKNAREPGYDIFDLFISCLRLNPDRVMVSEIRDTDIIPFLNTISSGHDGAITTLHARSASDAFDRMLSMVRRSPEYANVTDDQIIKMLKRYIDVVMVFDKDSSGARRMTEIYYGGAEGNG